MFDLEVIVVKILLYQSSDGYTKLRPQAYGFGKMKLIIITIIVTIVLFVATNNVSSSIPFKVNAQSYLQSITTNFSTPGKKICGELPGANMTIINVPCNENGARTNNGLPSYIASRSSCTFIGFFLCR
ncbi:MAG: hypothetical protein WAZ77_18990 [Candidatus Nitrosopolaris sp.]